MIVLSTVLVQLNPRGRSYLKKQDKTRAVILIPACILQFIVSVSYVVIKHEEVEYLEKALFFDSMELLMVFGVTTTLCLSMMMAVCTLHLTILTVAQTYADNICDRMLKLLSSECIDQTQAFVQTKHLISSYTAFVKNINENFGMIPLTVFAILFANIVLAISFVSLESSVSFACVVTTFGGIVAMEVTAIIQIIAKSSNNKILIEKSFDAAQELSSQRLVKRSLIVIEPRKSLITFLSQRRIPRMTAMSMFDIVLSFLNAVIPFTIMFVTTIS